jgi:hypothetical protein
VDADRPMDGGMDCASTLDPWVQGDLGPVQEKCWWRDGMECGAVERGVPPGEWLRRDAYRLVDEECAW